MTAGDTVIENSADRLAELSDSAAQAGGLKAKLAPELEDDSAFLRKLKPSLILQRARGQRGIEPSPADRPKLPKRSGKGANPFVIAAAAFAVGIVTAKLVDWRGHAHPRV